MRMKRRPRVESIFREAWYRNSKSRERGHKTRDVVAGQRLAPGSKNRKKKSRKGRGRRPSGPASQFEEKRCLERVDSLRGEVVTREHGHKLKGRNTKVREERDIRMKAL